MRIFNFLPLFPVPLLPLVFLNQPPIHEHPVSLRPHSGKKKFPPLLDGDVMFLVDAHHQFVPLCEFQRGETKVCNRGLPIDFDFQIADELIEREVDAMLFVNADGEAEVHIG